MSDLRYVMITPARNEEENIGRLIESVVAQTLPPVKWVIVSDNSTDATDDIVQTYAEQHPFIHLVRRDEDGSRAFSSMAGAVSLGYERLQDLEFDMVAKMDADMSMDSDCFERLLAKCDADPKVGRAGALLIQKTEQGMRNHLATPDYHVSGGLELFRRACYEKMGGFQRPAYGGTDTIADVMARMHGWKVQTFTDVNVVHHGRVGEYRGSIHWGRFYHGVQDYTLGYHPVFFLAKLVRRLKYWPYGMASFQQGAGYVYACLRRFDCVVEPEVRAFIRNEQKERLRESFRSLVLRDRSSAATG